MVAKIKFDPSVLKRKILYETIVFIYHMSPFTGQMLYLLAFFKSWKLCIDYYSERPPSPQFYHDTVKINC